jgi:hypothetical protein
MSLQVDDDAIVFNTDCHFFALSYVSIFFEHDERPDAFNLAPALGGLYILALRSEGITCPMVTNALDKKSGMNKKINLYIAWSSMQRKPCPSRCSS